MKVVEIFRSVDGEGKRAGLPTTFIRFFGCNLRCAYCDTVYGWDAQYEQEAKDMTVDEVVGEVIRIGIPNITITGGEPLCQPQDELLDLLKKLGKKHFVVNIESNGSIVPIGHDLPNVFYTLDYKTHASGMSFAMSTEALQMLTDKDVLKFVVGSLEDCAQAYEIIQRHSPCAQIYFSPVFGKIEPKEIVQFLLDRELYHCKVQVQLHKILWDPNLRGV